MKFYTRCDMKAKVTKPDGTIIELEGDPIELAILLPEMKGYTKIHDRVTGILPKDDMPDGWTLLTHNDCSCVSNLG